MNALLDVLPALIKERENDTDEWEDGECQKRLQLYEAVRAFGAGEHKPRQRGRPKSASRHWAKALCGPIYAALIEAMEHEPSPRVGGAFVSVMIDALKTVGKENVSPSAVSQIITDFLKD